MYYVIAAILGVLAGLVGGVFIARKQMQDYLKKNPPINEEMMRTMMTQMGQKPNEAKLRQMMKAMNAAQEKSKK